MNKTALCTVSHGKACRHGLDGRVPAPSCTKAERTSFAGHRAPHPAPAATSADETAQRENVKSANRARRAGFRGQGPRG